MFSISSFKLLVDSKTATPFLNIRYGDKFIYYIRSVMNLNLNPELNRRLRKKINEWLNFTYEKQANFKSPEKSKRLI